MTTTPDRPTKSASVEWLGTLPDHWQERPLWSLFRRVKDVDHPDETMLSVFRDYGVVEKHSRTNLNVTAENRSIYQLVHPGWLVANRMKAWQGSVGVSPHRGIVSGHYICFEPRHHEEPRFLNWLLRSSTYTTGYLLMSRGVRIGQAEIDNDEFRRLPVVLPPKDEQRAIADYLDRETAKIDTLIAKQRQLMEALFMRRKQMIMTATGATRNPLDQAASTGLTAIGKHFTVTLGKMLDAGKSERRGDSLLPYLRAANIQDHGLDLGSVNRMPYSNAEARNLDLRAGDLLVVEGGAVGTCAVLDQDMPGWSFQKTVNRVRPLAGHSTRYLGYVLRAYRDSGVMDILCNKATIPHLTAEKLRALKVPLPSADEQVRIANELDAATARIDLLLDRSNRLVVLSAERRAALITAAVTGQIDVRGQVA